MTPYSEDTATRRLCGGKPVKQIGQDRFPSMVQLSIGSFIDLGLKLNGRQWRAVSPFLKKRGNKQYENTICQLRDKG